MSIYENVYHPHQKTARALLQISDDLNQIYLDQWQYLQHITAQNMLEIDAERHVLSLANGLLKLHFSNDAPMLRIEYAFPDKKYDKLEQFLLVDMPFFTGNQTSQHPTTVKTRSQVLRQTLIEQVFEWIDGEDRIERFIYNISLHDAMAIDHLLIQENYYSETHLSNFVNLGHQIPLEVELNLKHLCLVNSIQGELFIQVNALLQYYDRVCYAAKHFMPAEVYRIIETTFIEQFHLNALLKQQKELQILIPHAKQHANVLGFSRLMLRGYWQQRDLLARKYFLEDQPRYWDDVLIHQFPIFHYSRTVNLLFKQDALVNDWLSQHINHPSVRISMTALSFVDCSDIHPQVMLLTLRYFKNIAARLFLSDCNAYASEHQWFSDEQLAQMERKGIKKGSVRLPLSNSILYIEEWLKLLRYKTQDNPQVLKQVYLKLSRVMQAYMRFLQQLTTQIPSDLVVFIDPDCQQQPEFFHLLKQHKLKVDDFRCVFRHSNTATAGSISVFSSDVADYLVEFFHQRRKVSKNVTWQGLYQQACRWHMYIRRQKAYDQLRARVSVDSWESISPMTLMYHGGWRYQELNSLEDIVQESIYFKHCLAISYTERIVEHEYVAFHMQHLNDPSLKLTLGCHFQYGRLEYDQVRLQNNTIPEHNVIVSAQLFVDELNDYLRLESYNPEAVSLDRFQAKN